MTCSSPSSPATCGRISALAVSCRRGPRSPKCRSRPTGPERSPSRRQPPLEHLHVALRPTSSIRSRACARSATSCRPRKSSARAPRTRALRVMDRVCAAEADGVVDAPLRAATDGRSPSATDQRDRLVRAGTAESLAWPAGASRRSTPSAPSSKGPRSTSPRGATSIACTSACSRVRTCCPIRT